MGPWLRVIVGMAGVSLSHCWQYLTTPPLIWLRMSASEQLKEPIQQLAQCSDWIFGRLARCLAQVSRNLHLAWLASGLCPRALVWLSIGTSRSLRLAHITNTHDLVGRISLLVAEISQPPVFFVSDFCNRMEIFPTGKISGSTSAHAPVPLKCTRSHAFCVYLGFCNQFSKGIGIFRQHWSDAVLQL